MENENQAVESGVTTESPSGNAETQQAASQENGSQGANTQQTESQYVPYSRFKELVEQKNQTSAQMNEYQNQLRQMQRQMSEWQKTSQTQQQKEDALHARLKGIDPEFGERFAKVDSTLSDVAQLKQWVQEQQHQRTRDQGVSIVNSLHSENKVPKEIQDLYNAQIDAKIMANPRASLDDLPGIYKSVHETFQKYVDSVKRSTTESYVKEKKGDAAIPSQAKGAAATPNKKGFEYSKNPDDARQQVVANVMKSLREGRQSS